MSSSASTSASFAGSRKRRFEKENKTILSSVLPEDEAEVLALLLIFSTIIYACVSVNSVS